MPLFLFIFHILYTHTFIQSLFIHPSPFAEASLHFFIACMLSGEDLPVVPSRESNSGLPYSKPTRCQLRHAAPYCATPHHQLRHAAPCCATPHHTAPRRTILRHAAPLYCATPHHTAPRRTINFKLIIYNILS
jgi:hypothetical protein